MARARELGTRKTRQVEPGDVPRLATTQDFAGSNPPLTGRTHAKRTKSTKPGGINLRTVAEACIAEGLDPALAIAKALTDKVQARDRFGTPIFDDKGKPVMVDAVDPDTRLRVLQGLLEYTQPKLKSVEVKMSGTVDLTSEQLDERLAALLAKAKGGR